MILHVNQLQQIVLLKFQETLNRNSAATVPKNISRRTQKFIFRLIFPKTYLNTNAKIHLSIEISKKISQNERRNSFVDRYFQKDISKRTPTFICRSRFPKRYIKTKAEIHFPIEISRKISQNERRNAFLDRDSQTNISKRTRKFIVRSKFPENVSKRTQKFIFQIRTCAVTCQGLLGRFAAL